MVNLYDRVTSIGRMYAIRENALYIQYGRIHCIYNTIQYTKIKIKNLLSYYNTCVLQIFISSYNTHATNFHQNFLVRFHSVLMWSYSVSFRLPFCKVHFDEVQLLWRHMIFR